MSAAVVFLALAVLAAVLDFLLVLELDVFLALAAGCLITFDVFGVGCVVQCQAPFARAHATSSLAVSYASLCAIILCKGSRSTTLPLVFERLNFVASEKYATNAWAGIVVPAGKV